METLKSHEIMPLLKHYLPENPIIIEAGAFNGKDTLRMASLFPAAQIHCFEPVPHIFERLTQTTQHLENVHRYPLALSDSDGEAVFHVAEKPEKPGIPTQAGSLLSPKERLKYSTITFPETIKVPTIKLDNWAQKYTIDHVDLLWLDTQGTELAIMQASPLLMKTVKAIVTEVEFVEAYAGQPQYEEVKRWLEDQGFVCVARDFSDQPSWFFGNILMIRNPEICLP